MSVELQTGYKQSSRKMWGFEKGDDGAGMNNRSHHRTLHRLTNHSALARQRKPACRAGGSFRCKECELGRSAGLAAFGRGIHATLSWCFARLTL